MYVQYVGLEFAGYLHAIRIELLRFAKSDRIRPLELLHAFFPRILLALVLPDGGTEITLRFSFRNAQKPALHGQCTESGAGMYASRRFFPTFNV